MNEAVNYTKEAFLATGNLVFLLVAAVVSTAVGLLPIFPPWLFGGLLACVVGTELLYLGIRSAHPSFRRAVRAGRHNDGEAGPSQSQVYRRLSRRSQRRYYRLRQLREEIRANYQELNAASQGLLEAHLKKLDELLRSYLDLLYQRERYYGLASRGAETDVRQSLQALEEQTDAETERVRSVKQRRIDVLNKRLDRLREARENLAVVGAQLGAIEDVVKYIHEQSWTLQDPDEVTMQLDTLIEEVEDTQRSVREIEAAFSRPSASDDDLAALDDELAAAMEEASGPAEDDASSATRPSRVQE